MSKGPSYSYSGTKGDIINAASNFPKNPDKLLTSGWTETSHPRQAAAGSREFINDKTGLKIRFDKARPGANGFEGKDHYHIYNPNAKDRKDLYLDKDSNPVRKGHDKSHIVV